MNVSNPAVIKIDTCEVCETNLEGPELDFGYQPLCDELYDTPEKVYLYQNIIKILFFVKPA